MKPINPESIHSAAPARVLTLAPLPGGGWSMTDSLQSIGGLFVDMRSALRYARLECGEALVLVRSGPLSG